MDDSKLSQLNLLNTMDVKGHSNDPSYTPETQSLWSKMGACLIAARRLLVELVLWVHETHLAVALERALAHWITFEFGGFFGWSFIGLVRFMLPPSCCPSPMKGPP